jgi:cysteine desulfurase
MTQERPPHAERDADSSGAQPAPGAAPEARPAIYLDHHSTTPVDPRVLDAMLPYYTEHFGNAASTSHVFGWRAEGAVEDARERIASALGAQPREVVFTSGASESNNIAILGTVEAHPGPDAHVVSVVTEHPSVLDPCQHLESTGRAVTIVGVGRDGLVDPAAIEGALCEDTVVVSVMAANNEIGVLQPIEEIAQLCRARGVLFHSDAAQAIGRIPLRVDTSPIDLLSISAHKLYGPKGIGALFVRAGRPRVRIAPRQFGGGHEGGLRPGTLPVALIVGLARALELCLEEQGREAERLRALRDDLWAQLSGELSGIRINGHPDRRLPGNLNVSFEGVDAARLLLALPDVAVSTGSACASASPEPSHVLLAIGVPEPLARASLRFGLGRGNTPADTQRAAARIVDEVRKLRAE